MKTHCFEAIVRALSNIGVCYLVARGRPVNAHGHLRFTKFFAKVPNSVVLSAS
jgi:hypothetical protein